MSTTHTPFVTREAWLQALVEKVTPWCEDAGLTVPPVRISVGYTSKGLRSNRIGECWHPEAVEDHVPTIFVHPGLRQCDVGHVVVHELIHASLGPGAKHGPLFRRPALALGLTGRMTATVPSPELQARLDAVCDDLGAYPHGVLTPTSGLTSTGPKQSTRMLKVECPGCGYTVRTTRKWLEIGTPRCPCGEDMVEAS